MKKKIFSSLRTLLLISYVLGALGLGLTIIISSFIWGWKYIILFLGGSFFIYLGTIALVLTTEKIKQ